jgi:hypothetical protein
VLFKGPIEVQAPLIQLGTHPLPGLLEYVTTVFVTPLYIAEETIFI